MFMTQRDGGKRCISTGSIKSAEHVGDHAPTYVFVNHFLILGDEIVMTDGRRRGLIYCIGCLEISRGMLHRILTRVQEPS
jgi:hypothetical protein